MGYTHYWTVKRETPPELLREAGAAMARVVEAARVDLGDGRGEGRPILDPSAGRVVFNGRANERDDSHETFLWPPNLGDPQDFLQGLSNRPDGVFTFCKTAMKPYDPVVVACLLVAQQILGDFIEVTSDASDFAEFAGAEQSEGWRVVNAMLGSPTEIDHAENAVQLYERVFSTPPPIPPCLHVEEIVGLNNSCSVAGDYIVLVGTDGRLPLLQSARASDLVLDVYRSLAKGDA